MSNLTRRGASANNPAKLPALMAGRAQDPHVQRSLEVIREWLEVRLGSRGDRFERAVTFRDLDAALATIEARLDALAVTAAAAPAGSGEGEDGSAALASLQSTVSTLAAEFRREITLVRALIDSLRFGDFSTNTATSVVDELVLFADTAGKLGKRATGSGYARLASGVLAVDSLATLRTDLQGDGAAADQIGFRGIPMSSRSADYTLVLADAGKGTLHPAADANARTFTIPANASVAFPVGSAHTFVNETSQAVTIAITSDTLVLGGTTTTGSRTLAQNGVATALKVTSTKWIISGAGLT